MVRGAAATAARPISGDVGVPVLHEGPRAFTLGGAAKHLGRLETVKVTGQNFERAIRAVTTTTPGAEPLLHMSAPTIAAVHAGDVLFARFWLRCHDSMTGEAFATFTFETTAADAVVMTEFRIGAGAEWREVNVPFRATRHFAPGEARVCFRLGFDRQTVDIGGIDVRNYGGDARLSDFPTTVITYAGRERDAAWREAAHARIEKHR